jgi:uncharacterized repeat protein (TIGR03806 family)
MTHMHLKRFFCSIAFLVGAAFTQAPTSQASADDTVNDAALMAEKPAKLLSEYRLFEGTAQVPNTNVLPYGLVNELFTDYAAKSRLVYIPAGKTAKYQPDETLVFPIGAVLIKTFAFPADFREPEKDIRLIETRLLIHQSSGWKTYAYVWDEDESDARLKIAGKRFDVSFIDSGGRQREISYKVPNINECKGCHALGKVVTPIGPKARNLNRDYPYPDVIANQLEHWAALGILSGLPDKSKWPSVPAWNDETQPVDRRARSYLDINCAHCHRSEGPASNSGLFLTYGEKTRAAWGYRKRPVAAGKGSGGHEFAIAPGQPEKSILIYRMKSLEPGQMMPELGRSLSHNEAIAMLEGWIRSLD